MACEAYRDLLVARLYDELDPADAGRLDAHLERCTACRDDLAQLAFAREQLRRAESLFPVSPRVVLLSPRPFRRPIWAFAAGFACAMIVLAAGLGAGWTLRDRETPVGAGSNPLAAGVTRAEVEGLLRQQEATLDHRLEAARISAPASPAAALTREDLDAAFSRLEKKIEGRRAADMGYLLDAISASELRSNTRLGQTREALRYVALASDPRVSAQ
ncbi:MAG: zf-HC2 domain-containing protein [Acidobacteriia bacterium]|nr:zf-HC2 domain-containing protein [Terriglobia bacterium]